MDELDSTEEKVEALSDKIDELERELDETKEGRNEVELKSHDIKVKVKSETASLEQMHEIAHKEADFLTERALKGHMVELEEKGISLFE